MYVTSHINHNVFRTKVLTKKNDIKLGMMGKTFTKEFDALLFVKKELVSSFWMKNCIIPLDVIFIHDNIITTIHHSCPPCKEINDDKCLRYKGTGDLVIEMLGGTCQVLGIKAGDRVIFNHE